jgi:ubiquinone/menaquinone biosynthesis C-methylase UbiE
MSTDKKSIAWYDENAHSYTEHVRNQKDSVYHSLYEKPAMYALLPELRGKKVISLGCGSGEDSHYLKLKGADESVGIDISKELIKIAIESYPECIFKVMDMEALDFPDASFNFAYSSLAIHYIEDWSKVFAETFRVLKPNSYFLFSCGHPIRSAMEVREEDGRPSIRQLAIVKRLPEKSEIIGNYLDRKSIHDALGSRMGNEAVTTWHKSISEIVREARTAGFLVEQFIEPKPLEEMKAITEKSYIRLSKIPEFMIFRLLKPQ